MTAKRAADEEEEEEKMLRPRIGVDAVMLFSTARLPIGCFPVIVTRD